VQFGLQQSRNATRPADHWLFVDDDATGIRALSVIQSVKIFVKKC